MNSGSGLSKHKLTTLDAKKKSVPKPQTAYEIFLLPDSLLQNVFSYLSFDCLVRIRKVCRWWYYVAGSMLNQKFLSMRRTIGEEISLAKKNDKSNGYLRILYIMKSEVKMLEAHCAEYVVGNMLFFYGGLIIDSMDSIMKSKKCDECTLLVSELFVLVDEFLDNFDEVKEPLLLKRTMHLPFSWFGKKLVDILDCYTNFDFTVTLEPNINGMFHKWNGAYDAPNVASILPPPFIPNTTNASQADMSVILKFLRNHIRWNNVLNHINVTNNEYENYLVEVSPPTAAVNPKIIYTGKVRRNEWFSLPQQSLNITLDLFCHNILAPRKIREALSLARFPRIFPLRTKKSLPVDELQILQLDVTPIEPCDYELNLTVEATYKGGPRNSLKTTTIQICQVNNMCYVASNTDELND